ncbi:MAG: glycoside hydrolase family 1 protein [Chloroflexi bacterium]|nr:glycoside hydrolase family 1 protein [Chloroflexota bacterium]
MSKRIFPNGFLWGAGTAAHQVEGGNTNNDWWDWEQVPGRIKHGDTSAVACDWWRGERYRDDFELAAQLHQNAHRLSLEWSRLEPREGEWSADAIAFYRRMLSALRDHGMTPLVTLHHFTNPRWLTEKGGWETEATIARFARYADKAVQEFGDLCDSWVTINEPNVYAFSAYVSGRWSPGKKDVMLALRVLTNLVRGHAAAYRALHRVQPHVRVGVAHHVRALRPANPRSSLNRTLVRLQNHVFNRLFLDALHNGRMPLPFGAAAPEAINTQDFIGLNFYFSARVAVDWRNIGELFGRQTPPQPWGVANDAELREWFGWGDIDPDAFYDVVMDAARAGKPIYITEHGIPDARDEIRPRVLVTYLAALHRAIQDGADVRGYFHWALIDNFEWIEGLDFLRFGLIANDFATQTRAPRPSAHLYARIARENALADELMEKYGH